MTCHFEVAEYFKREPSSSRGNEIQPQSGEEEEVEENGVEEEVGGEKEEEEDFVCFFHCSGAQMEDLD